MLSVKGNESLRFGLWQFQLSELVYTRWSLCAV